MDALGKSLNAVLEKNGPIRVRYPDGNTDWLKADDPQRLLVYGRASEFLVNEEWLDRAAFRKMLLKVQRRLVPPPKLGRRTIAVMASVLLVQLLFARVFPVYSQLTDLFWLLGDGVLIFIVVWSRL